MKQSDVVILLAILFATLLVTLILCSSPVAAYSITSMELLSDGQPVGAFSPSHSRPVTLRFETDLNRGSATLDLSQLGAPTRKIDLAGCSHNATTNTTICEFLETIAPQGASTTVAYRLFAKGTEYPGNLTLQFTIDNSSPVVTSVKTAACHATVERCYIGNGLLMNVTILLEDPDGTFTRNIIFFKLGTKLFTVKNCTATECIGTALVTCGDNQPLDLAVTSANGVPSQDDAGNPVANPDEVTRVICDATPPAIINITANGTGVLGLITADGTLTITALVQESATTVTMVANTTNLVSNESAVANSSKSRIENISCVRGVNDLHVCTLAVTGLLAGRNKKVPLVFKDAVGHETKAILTVPIIFTTANASETPDFFAAKATNVVPNVVNRVALQLALDNAVEYPYFINYEFTRKSEGARILEQRLDATTCQTLYGGGDPYGAQQGNWSTAPALFEDPIKVFYPNADWNVKNRLDANFLNLNTDKLRKDLLAVKCNLSLVVEKDGTIYSVPEQETIYFPVRLRNSKLGTPGEAFLNKINAERDELNGGVMKLIGTANQLMSTMTQLCQIQDILLMLQTPALTMQGMGILMLQYGVGQGLAQHGNTLWGMMALSSMNFWMGQYQIPSSGSISVSANGQLSTGVAGDQGGLLKQICSYVYCDTANKIEEAAKTAEKDGGNWLLAGDQKFSDDLEKAGTKAGTYGGDYFKDLNTPDVSNSLIMSLATRCWGGVVYNLNKYREIDCGYLHCLKEQALGGASIAPCELGRGVKLCRFVTGELFELPYIRVMKNLAANINKLVQSPLLLLANHLNAGACANTDTDWGVRGFGCHLLKTIKMQQSFESVTKYNKLFSFPYQADFCQKALCEGKECDRTTSSFLEQLSPGFGYAGDTYRRKLLAEKEEKERKQEYANLVADLKTWDETTALTPHMQAYAKQNGIKDPVAFYHNILSSCGNSKDGCVVNFGFLLEKGYDVSSEEKFDQANGQLANIGKSVPYQGFTTLNTLANELKRNGYILVCTDGRCSIPKCSGATDAACASYNARLAEAQSLMKGYTVQEINGRLELCPDGQTTGCVDAATASKSAFDAEKSLRNQAAFRQWVGIMTDIVVQYMMQKGYFEVLTIGGWGDWGKELSADANTYFNPEEWQNSLCNPAGTFNDYTQDTGTVYAWQEESYRAVLTFAGEVLRVSQRADTQEEYRIYTVSAVVVSPFEENEFSIVVNPGGKVVVGRTPVSKSLPVNKAASFNDTRRYTELCIIFTKPFPKKDGEMSFCRPLQRNAYDRGASGELPNFGVDDPYGETWGESISGNPSLTIGGQYGSVTGGTSGVSTG